MRPRTKEDLLTAAHDNYEKLLGMIASLTEHELNTPFDFSADPKKHEAHWQRDKNLRDVLIHLYEWQQLLIAFVENNKESDTAVPFLPSPYTWKSYGEMNIALWQQHQQTSPEEAMQLLATSHATVIALAESYTNEQLFTKRYYRWTGTTDLGSYFVSTTSSHYEWALKKLKEHRKNCKQ